MQRWVTFDCYGTLIDWDRGIGDALADLFPGTERAELLAAYHRLEPEVQAGSDRPYREVLAACARAIGDELGIQLPPAAEEGLPASLPSWPPFPEVATSLATLRTHGWKLAVLSNTDRDLLDASIQAIGVGFDERITVAEAGSYKPASGHWEAFFARTSADRARHVHVAASLFHDIEPCAARGINAIWINRSHETTEVAHLTELPDLVELPQALATLVPAA